MRRPQHVRLRARLLFTTGTALMRVGHVTSDTVLSLFIMEKEQTPTPSIAGWVLAIQEFDSLNYIMSLELVLKWLLMYPCRRPPITPWHTHLTGLSRLGLWTRLHRAIPWRSSQETCYCQIPTREWGASKWGLPPPALALEGLSAHMPMCWGQPQRESLALSLRHIIAYTISQTWRGVGSFNLHCCDSSSLHILLWKKMGNFTSWHCNTKSVSHM